jgi:aspartyl-tRNA(Asn)/glutamyl-tRNA(Gln) amidotransferase subunit C
MKVDKELIDNVAYVARLELSEKEKEKFVKEFKEILDAFSAVDKVDTSKVKNSFQPVELKNMAREDNVEPSFSQEKALANTQHKKDGYFKGPRAV